MSVRTSTPRKSSKIKFAVSGLALAAAAAGTVSVWPASAAAQQAAGAGQSVQTAPATTLALAVRAKVGVTTLAAQLDSASAVLTTSPVPKGGTASGRRARYIRLTPRQIARQMLRSFHWAQWQYRWLNLLWSRESGWNVHASNGYSGAYGIPQAVPGSKMSSAGPNWTSSARTQIRWGLRYIKAQYGSPHMAWEHELATGWY